MGESKLLAAKIIIAVSKEEQGAGIYLVGEQQLSEDPPVLWVFFECVIAGIIIIIYVLNDSAEKCADVELVDSCRLEDVCRIQARILNGHPLKGVREGQAQVLAEIVSQIRSNSEPFSQPCVLIVDLISKYGGH